MWVLLVRWTRIWEASVLSLKCLEHWRRDQKIQSWDKDRIEQQYERRTHTSLTESLTGPWVAGKRSQPQLWESEYDWQVTSLTWKSHLHHYPSPRRQHFGTWCECELKVNDKQERQLTPSVLIQSRGCFAILEAFIIISYQCGRETIPPRICSFQHRTEFAFHRKHTEIIQKSVTLKQLKSIENVVFIVLILGKKLIINCNLRKRKEIWSKWFMCGRPKIREKFK